MRAETFCMNCGKGIASGSRFCPECGTAQSDGQLSSQDASVATTNVPQRGVVWWITRAVFAGVAILIVLAVIGAIAGNGSPSGASAGSSSSNSGVDATPSAPVSLFSIKGTGTHTTDTFTTPSAAWELNWDYDCSDFGSTGNFIVEVHNSDGSTLYEDTPVNQLGAGTSGTEYYHTGGTVYLTVDSECKWNISGVG